MLVHHLYELDGLFLLSFVVLKVFAEIEKILEEVDSGLKGARWPIMPFEDRRIDEDINIFRLDLRIPSVLQLSSFVIPDDSLEKLIGVALHALEVLDILIQGRTLHVLIMLPHLLHQLVVVFDHWLQDRHFRLADVLLDGLHVEVVEVGEVEVELADLLHCLSEVVVLEVAMEDDEVADLRDLDGWQGT